MPAPSDANPNSPSASANPPPQPVISNTTPLISLGEIGLLDALGALYGDIWIPATVLAEYQRGRTAHPQRPDLIAIPWLSVHSAPADSKIPTSLDAGERDAIALARAAGATRILLDERDARRAARLGLIVTGSVGVLLASKDAGIIQFVKPYLDRIVAQGRYISPALYQQVLRQAGE